MDDGSTAAAGTAATPPRAFATPGAACEVVALVVTHNSRSDLDGLLASLRDQVRPSLRIGVVVVDNASADGSLEAASAHPDVHAVAAPGNVGYAAALNLARTLAPRAETLLVLNPDVRLRPGAVAALLARARQPAAGVVAPLVLDDSGRVYPSVRREPSVGRALGDALVGARLPHRPGRLAETDWAWDAYRQARRIDWATGAALLVRAEVHDAIDGWDERFFLYSEETDFCRRARDAGYDVWFEPGATVVHSGGGSGTSPGLTALLVVNKVRYARKVGSAWHAAGIHGAVLTGSLLRAGDPGHRAAAAALLRRTHRDRLPGPTPNPPARPTPTVRPSAAPPRHRGPGAVVVPAHDEARVIDRTLRPLTDLALEHGVEVVVVVNGSSDDTAARARTHPGVTVLELPEASKTAALRAGDAAATGWPRLYLDADVEADPAAVLETLEALRTGPLLAARPRAVHDTQGAAWPVRRFYRARARVASLHQGLWGGGAYALSEAGHERLDTFPDLVGDDLWVDRLFTDDEKAVLDGAAVRVRTPRTTRGLLAVLGRVQRGNVAVAAARAERTTTRSTARELLGTVDGVAAGLDAATYAALIIGARTATAWRARRATTDPAEARWERDLSSRV